MLKWVTVALVIVLCIAAPVAAQEPPKPDGTWAIKVDFEKGLMYLSYLQNFTADGRTTLILPWESPLLPDYRVGCMGEWKVRPGRAAKDYDFTIRCLYDQTWDSTYGEIRGILVMDKGGDKWTAEFTYYDWTGGTQGWGGKGVMYADRIGIKPLR
jgi:hypothetical protein